MSSLDKAVKELTQVLTETRKNQTSPYDTQAEVIRVDGDIAWVHIPGGVDETPVKLTMNAQVGDIVQVRVSGGNAWLQGNATSPPTDDTRANQAMNASEVSLTAAESAVKDAIRASEAAAQAEETAKGIEGIAKSAKTAADTAYTATNVALSQLGIVEDIIGVIELIQKNGEYGLTSDIEVQPNKWYFEREGTSPNYTYKAVTVPYELTNDVVVVEGKTYYTRSGTAPNYEYTPVENPVTADIGTYYERNPSAQGLYEIYGVSETIQNYVSSHLVLTDSGLSLQTDKSDYRIDIAPTGIEILNGGGFPVAQYGETAIIGLPNGFHIVIGKNEQNVSEIGFYNGSTKLAYMNGAELYVTNSLAFGHFTFVERANGHFTLKLIH